MRKLVPYAAAFAAVATMMGMSLSASAAPNPNSNANGGNKLQCFSGTTDGGPYGGTCSIANGSATLDNSDGNVNGDYSGVYIQGSNLSGKMLSNVGQLSFNYTGTPTAGSPRISLPVDTNGDGVTDVYAFIGANLCNNGAGVVDAINNPSCTIFITGGPVSGYAGWSAFASAYPTATIGPDGALPFIIADDAGLWTVSNVRLGKASRTTGK